MVIHSEPRLSATPKSNQVLPEVEDFTQEMNPDQINIEMQNI